MSGLVDSGWAAWLPHELVDALAALEGPAADRRRLARRLAGRGPPGGPPPRPVDAPDPVEVVLALDEEEVRELERVRQARDPGEPATPVADLPSLDARFGGGDV